MWSSTVSSTTTSLWLFSFLLHQIVISFVPEANAAQDVGSLSVSSNTIPSYSKGSKGGLDLKVLNLNAWGLNWPWAVDRPQRFRALAEIIRMENYDIVLLQEVWFRSDYEELRHSLPFITYFESFSMNCAGYLLPLGCSGLTILSKHPIEIVDFMPFTNKGSFWNFDGEIFVSKGVARARVKWKGYNVDVFSSHFVSYDHKTDHNAKYRFLQSVETLRYIKRSDADIKIFGGDLNALPFHGPQQPYAVLASYMTDALIDRHSLTASLHPWFSTYGNMRNTYTGGSCPERIDYLMFWTRPGLHMRTEEFVMPVFMTKDAKGKLISLSDHEALHAEFVIHEGNTSYGNKNDEAEDHEHIEHYHYDDDYNAIDEGTLSPIKDM